MKRKAKLNKHERDLISLFLSNGKGIRTIARELDRSPSTICEEIKRNSTKNGYSSIQAHLKSQKRLQKSQKVKPLKKDWIIDYVIRKLQMGWSPEQIAGRLKRENNGKTIICHETIYRYIYSHPEKELSQYLTKNHKRRKRKVNNWLPYRGISNRTSIHDRPKEIDNRTTFGHWEIDTVEGKGHSGGITTVLERKTRYYDGQKIPVIDSETGIWSQKKLLLKHPKVARKTATMDNGKENYNHRQLNKFGIKTYFCDPYSSWQKGSNENYNGILRRYIPKRTDFSTFTQVELDAILKEINNRPRKCLNYLTPKEAFKKELLKL